MRSPTLPRIKFCTTPFATVIRLGEISSASIESEISNTIMISCGILFVVVVVHTRLGHAIMTTRLATISVRMIHSIHILTGVSRCLEIKVFGCMVPIFSRPKMYQIARMIGMSARMMGRENENIDYIRNFPISSLCMLSISSLVSSLPEYTVCSSCSMIAMSLVSVEYFSISLDICAQLCIG